MAYAIDEIRSDDRATNAIGSAGAIASWSRGCRAPRACHPVARRRGYLFEHYGQDRLQLPDDRALEASLRSGWHRRTQRAPSGLEADRVDAGAAGPHPRVDSTHPAARRDALVHAIVGPQTWRAAHHRGPRVARCRSAAASPGALHALDRSRVRDESRGRDRPVPRTATTRRRVLRRRENGHSGARPGRPSVAVVAWPSGTPRV